MKTFTYPYELKPVSAMLSPEQLEEFRTAENFGTSEERAARGAALLDAWIPDWTSRVKLNELSLSSRCNCVLGQLFHPLVVNPEADRSSYDSYNLNGDEDVLIVAGETEAQVYGMGNYGYDLGRRLLDTDELRQYGNTIEVYLGFDRGPNEEDQEGYSALTEAWTALINERTAVTA